MQATTASQWSDEKLMIYSVYRYAFGGPPGSLKQAQQRGGASMGPLWLWPLGLQVRNKGSIKGLSGTWRRTVLVRNATCARATAQGTWAQ